MPESNTRISNASSYSEIGEYWDTHDLSEHWDETKEVHFQVDLNPQTDLLRGRKKAG